MANSRWEWLEGLKPRVVADALVHEAGKALAEDLASWPPPITWTDPRLRERFAPVLDAAGWRPPRAALTEGFRIARWELERDYEAISHAERNGLLAAALPDERERLAAQLVAWWAAEWLYELKEKTGSKLKRPQLLEALAQAELRVSR